MLCYWVYIVCYISAQALLYFHQLIRDKKKNKRSIYKEQVELKCYLNPQMNAQAAPLFLN